MACGRLAKNAKYNKRIARKNINSSCIVSHDASYHNLLNIKSFVEDEYPDLFLKMMRMTPSEQMDILKQFRKASSTYSFDEVYMSFMMCYQS